MSHLFNNLFNFSDRLQIESLNQRMVRNDVVTSNVANAETPGYRALGYQFEEQLKSLIGEDEPFPMRVSNPRHFRTEKSFGDGRLEADVFVRPTESITEDGNTVDVDHEMAEMAQNQILYRATIELINRKMGILRYGITGGGR